MGVWDHLYPLGENMNMKLAKSIALMGVLAMTGVLVFAFITGDFMSDGADVINNPWGVVSLVDLYTGFILFSGWIIYREKSFLSAFIWIFFMMTLGFFTGALYAFLALYKSGGDWKQFWMGKRAYDEN
jgi:hypothetical protein